LELASDLERGKESESNRPRYGGERDAERVRKWARAREILREVETGAEILREGGRDRQTWSVADMEGDGEERERGDERESKWDRGRYIDMYR